MATKRQLVNRCLELGCMLLDCGDSLRVDVPVGKTLNSTDCHSCARYTKGWTRPDAYAALLEDLELGIDDCECASCTEAPMEFNAIQKLYGGIRLA